MQPNSTIKKKRSLPAGLAEKGTDALKLWRDNRDAAKKLGPKAYAEWVEDQKVKREQRKVSPQQAIRNFCNSCVGDKRDDITNCSAKKCPLYFYRPYQKGEV